LEDEGEGFDVREIPGPHRSAKPLQIISRRVLLIYNIHGRKSNTVPAARA